MTTVSPTLAKVSAPPSSARPEPVKNRPSQAERLSYQAQAKARTNPAQARSSSHLGRNVDLRA